MIELHYEPQNTPLAVENQKENKKTSSASRTATVGKLFIGKAVLAAIGYFVLQSIFNYPAILDERGAIALKLFNQSGLIISLAFGLMAVGGGLLIVAIWQLYLSFSRSQRRFGQLLTVVGGLASGAVILSAIAWTLVMPFLAGSYQAGDSGAIDSYQAFKNFQLIVGQLAAMLLIATWTLMLSLMMLKSPQFKKWHGWFGLLIAFGLEVAAIQPLAQTIGLNLRATDEGQLDIAFLLEQLYRGMDALWLIWLVLVGLQLWRPSAPRPKKVKSK